MRKISRECTETFKKYLVSSERAQATVEKYTRDVAAFAEWLGSRELDREEVLLYKSELEKKFMPRSVNAALSSLNSFFSFIGRRDLHVKSLKIQDQIFASEERELTREEYERLIRTAKEKKNERLCLLMQTLCSAGLRVSELCFITVAAAERGAAYISCKGKHRQVLLPSGLCKRLRIYARARKIKSGPVFVTRNGNPLDRSNIFHEMKKLCKEARVLPTKVFPHNLRHLFARTYYKVKKDIVRLADILGHSNVNTTRIYTRENGETHRRQLQSLGLLLC